MPRGSRPSVSPGRPPRNDLTRSTGAIRFERSGWHDAIAYAVHLAERLDYALEGDELRIHTNNGYPYLTIRPEQGGWYIQDRVNYKLNISIDGPLAGGGDSQAATDGIVDWVSQVGSEQLGIPAWQTT